MTKLKRVREDETQDGHERCEFGTSKNWVLTRQDQQVRDMTQNSNYRMRYPMP